MPSLKEPGFFVFGEEPPRYTYPENVNTTIKWKIDDYFNLFKDAGEDQLIGEATTNYLYLYNQSITNIKRYIPLWQQLKIVIILREPSERAFSRYLLLRLWGLEPLEFEDALGKTKERLDLNWDVGFDYVGYGFYYNQVKAFLDSFPNVKIYLYEDLKADPLLVVKNIFSFLGVKNTFVPDISKKHKSSGVPKSWRLYRLLNRPNLVSSKLPFITSLIPYEKRVLFIEKLKKINSTFSKKTKMKPTTKKYLKNLYRNDIVKLQQLIGRDLSDWIE